MCDTLVAVTDDGVLFGKNSDRDVNEAQLLRWYPAAQHPAGTTLRCTWSTVAQAERTHAVLLSQPWWMWGAEIGANEHGVVIGNEAVFTRRARARGEHDEHPLLGMDLLRLALERAATRRAAVEVIVSLLERFGQGGSCSREHPRFTYDNSYIVADPDGATVLETAGRHWATEEVTGGRSISNGLTIPGFAARFADPVRGRVASCAARRDRTTAAASAARTPADLMAALRDHGGTTAPTWSPVNGALSAPCAHAGGVVTSTQSTASWVADLRAGARHWVTGTSAPCTGVFKPVSVAERLDLDPPAPASNRFDAAYLWWRHERMHRLAVRDLAAAAGAFAAERDRLEAEWLAAPPASAAAFEIAERAEAGWLDALERLHSADRRPGWVRRQWRGWDRAAGLEDRPWARSSA
jgi:dipeptidase